MKNALTFGILSGLALISSWLITQLFLIDESGQFDFSMGEITGYAGMLLSMVVVFIGVKKYRDAQPGAVSFKQAFLAGLYIVLVASAIYVVGWMIYYPNFMPDFTEQYTAHIIAQYEADGIPQSEIDEKVVEMEAWMESYKNPFVIAGMTFLEFFPIGLLFALIFGAVLKRKSKE
ncbi:MAG: DUF4199 domain-containing protein [Cyclobacteriaceae bacterium]